MLPKKNRVDKKTIEKIFKEGKVVNSLNLTFKFIKTNSGSRISFIAPKSVSRKAVIRNSLRRRGYFILKKYFNKFPIGLAGVFIFKKCQDDVSIIENEIKNILNKIN